MDKERRKTKKFVIGLFVAYLCIALVCFGIAAYIIYTIRGTGAASDRIADIAKIAAMTGILFLVLAFGYMLPALNSHKKREQNNGELDPSDLFDERNMKQALGKYIPAGETLLACIRAVSNEACMTGVFGKCVRAEDRLVPSKNGGTVAINKKKYATYDVYLGITPSSLIITECEKNSYYYQFDNDPDVSSADIQEVTSDVLFSDIGTCFPLTDLQSCKFKKGRMGSVKCFLTMKNGSYFKLMFPKFGDLGGGMPHHTEYREAIIAQLGGKEYR